MNYTFKQVNDTYVVWVASANRYMLLQEPAFRVLVDWTNQLPEGQIIRNCALEFSLGLKLARRFVKEVTDQLQSLVHHHSEDLVIECSGEIASLACQAWYSTKYYSIHGRQFCFRYGDAELEGLIHPGFAYLEQPLGSGKAAQAFDLWYSGENLLLQTGGQTTWKYPTTRREQFVGQVFLQLINGLYDSTDASWMGAVHASAVTAGKGAVLFTAPSGSGKSTFAALLMNRGYQVLSDDFSPLSLPQVKVYPFPEGISVKNRSLQALQSYFPSLADVGDSLPAEVREVHLPLPKGGLPMPVTAIVFLKYDPQVEVEFEAISNLEAMDRFMQQLWLPPTSQVATHFMNWYFQLPCYTLHYSDHEKAINSLSKLFQ